MESPTRVRTEEEKKNLQSLNKRLEFYILQQREKDASTSSYQRELDAQREKAEEQLRNARKWHQEQVEMLRAQRAETEEALASKSLENTKLLAEIASLKRELAKEQEYAQALSDKNRELTDSISSTRHILHDSRARNAELQNALDAERKKSQGLGEDLDASRALCADLRTRVEGLSKNVLNLQNDNEQERMKRRDVETVRRGLEQALKELQARLSAEDPMEKARVQRQLKDMQDKCDALLRDNIEHLEQLNEEKLAGFRVELEKVGHELAIQKEKLERARRESGDQVSRIADLDRIIADLNAKITQLEKELRAARLEPARISAEKNRIISRLKDEFMRKDKLFNDLMDVKVPFDLELKHLEQMLSNEERRLGLSGIVADPELVASPPKKRRHAPSKETSRKKLRSSKKPKRKTRSSARRKPPAEDPPAATGTYYVTPQEDENGSFIVLTNLSDADLETMDGWKLSFNDSGHIFKFPALSFQQDQSFTIRMTDNSESEHDNYVGIVPTGAWNQEGDKGYIENPQGVLIMEFDIRPKDSDAMEDDATQCSLM